MSDSVQLIKEKLDIVDVVSGYVELHKAGKNYKGKSPFTSEKTPSFYVTPDQGLYYCFSSNQGGDMFNFIQEMEGVDFKGALKLLAEKAGVELVPEDPQKKSERDKLYEIMRTATLFYEAALPRTPAASDYLKTRGLTEVTVKAWQVGYAPGPPLGGWRELREHLAAAGFDDILQQKAGLIKSAPAGKEPYDVFRDRIVFPMNDASGRPVAFSGRILHPHEQAPKYVNSPETELYKKSHLLFGYDKAKAGIRKLDFSLIVEGQFDVVMCHQAGYTNAVAVSGTALTPEHVRQLERLSNRVVLALDADRAGINAVKKSAAIMLAKGLDVKVAALPEGKDPADLIQAGKDNFKQVIGKAATAVEFLLSVLQRVAKDGRQFKLQAREEVIPLIAVIENKIDQEHFMQIMAERLGTSVTAVKYEVERYIAPDPGGHTPAPELKAGRAPVTSQERKQEIYHSLFAAQFLIKPEWAEQAMHYIAELDVDFVFSQQNTPSDRASVIGRMVKDILTNADERAVQAYVRDKLNDYRRVYFKDLLEIKSAARNEAVLAGDEVTARSLEADCTALRQEMATEIPETFFVDSKD